ncbi:acetyl-CoA acetyltransferase [Hyphomonas sp.]|uniref:acetyl-CoA acetyltransferase n=1 Tax=Hyphomonas sp. TaxID=87 RepID=UPI00391B8A1B
MAKGDLPVLVGVGQAMSQWDGKGGAAGAPSPLSLMADASKATLADTGASGIAAAIDALAVVRIFEDSVPGDRHPHGHNTNLPGTLARETGTNPAYLLYESVGGQSPQALVNEFARRIHEGEFEAVLISGSEANRASKGARKHGVEINWADGDARAFEDRGLGPMLLSRPEIKHGLVTPAYFYGLFENAIAAREGRTRSGQRRAMAELFQPFSAVAANNPYAQFPQEHSVEFLAAPSRENYEYADPFLKWFIAQDAVNQGAAAILVSSSKADALGIPEGKRVYLHGGGDAGDDHISVRPVLDRSWAMDVAVSRALQQAGRRAAEMKHLDLYSCFPCAVFSGAAALGIDPKTDKRALTLTGGLPFFGGPGNNYSLHGIAEMAATLRRNPGDFGLILANGGWMTKESAGVYSTTAPKSFTPAEAPAKPKEQVTLAAEDCEGALETFTVTHGKTGPERGIIFARLPDGRRILANNAGPDELAVLREEASPVGRKVRVIVKDENGTFVFV